MSTLFETNTLVNIAGHRNDIIRLSQFMAQTSFPFVVSKMLFLDENSDSYDIVMAFDEDLSVTATALKKIADIMDGMTEDGIVNLVDGPLDFKALFPNHFDINSFALTIFGQKVTPNTHQRAPEEWRTSVYESTFKGNTHYASYDAYKAHRKTLKDMSGTTRNEASGSALTAFEYAVKAMSVDKWHGFHAELLKKANNYGAFRSSLSDKVRKLLDERIVGGRAMVDGVTKASTFLSRHEITQTSPKHKDQHAVIAAIQAKLKNTPYITAVEIDEDADPVKVHDMIVDIENMSIDVPDAFVLKIRKLGNYGASGLSATFHVDGQVELHKEYGFSSNKLKVVAIDINSPTSLAHEITHFRDQDRDDPYRAKVIQHFAQKIDKNEIFKMVPAGSKFNIDYFMSHAEVLARLGEIGFLLNQHQYKDNETVTDFIARIEKSERQSPGNSDKISYQVNLVKSIDSYAGKNNPLGKQIYFNLEEWAPQELSIVRDYVHDFFYKQDPDIRKALEARIASGELDSLEKTHRAVRKKSKRRRKINWSDSDKLGALLSNLNPGELSYIYKKGVELDLFQDGDLPSVLFPLHDRLFDRGGKKPAKLSVSTMYDQIKEVVSLAQALNPAQRPSDAILLMAFLAKKIPSMHFSLAKAPLSEGQQHVEQLMARESRLSEMLAKTHVLNGNNYEDLNSIRLPLYDSRYRFRTLNSTEREVIQSMREALDKLFEKTPTETILADPDNNDLHPSLSVLRLEHVVFKDAISYPKDSQNPATLKPVADFISEQAWQQSSGYTDNVELLSNYLAVSQWAKAFHPDTLLKGLMVDHEMIIKSLKAEGALDTSLVSKEDTLRYLYSLNETQIMVDRKDVAEHVIETLVSQGIISCANKQKGAAQIANFVAKRNRTRSMSIEDVKKAISDAIVSPEEGGAISLLKIPDSALTYKSIHPTFSDTVRHDSPFTITTSIQLYTHDSVSSPIADKINGIASVIQESIQGQMVHLNNAKEKAEKNMVKEITDFLSKHTGPGLLPAFEKSALTTHLQSIFKEVVDTLGLSAQIEIKSVLMEFFKTGDPIRNATTKAALEGDLRRPVQDIFLQFRKAIRSNHEAIADPVRDLIIAEFSDVLLPASSKNKWNTDFIKNTLITYIENGAQDDRKPLVKCIVDAMYRSGRQALETICSRTISLALHEAWWGLENVQRFEKGSVDDILRCAAKELASIEPYNNRFGENCTPLAPIKLISDVVCPADPARQDAFSRAMQKIYRELPEKKSLNAVTTAAFNDVHKSSLKNPSPEVWDHLFGKRLKQLFIHETSQGQAASPVAVAMARDILIGALCAKDKRAYNNTIPMMLAEYIHAKNADFHAEHKPSPEGSYLYPKCTSSLEQGKAALNEMVINMDKISPLLPTIMLPWMTHQAMGINRSYNDTKGDIPLSRLSNSNFHETIKHNIDGLIDGFQERANLALLPLAASGQLFAPAQDIVDGIKLAMEAHDALQEMPSHVMDNNQAPDVLQENTFEPALVNNSVQDSAGPHQDTYEPVDFVALNTDVKPSTNGVLTMKQQYRMF